MDQKANYFAGTELFAKEVIECSSQYGEDGRTAFVAENLCGPPTIYPNFEDSTRSCAFLNYGSRWETYPGSLKPISGGPHAYSSTDYVDVFFERPLIVVRMKIYETFFPGAIVAIRACYRDQPTANPVNARGMYWATLWQSTAHGGLSNLLSIDGENAIVPADSVKILRFGKARIFVPDLFNIPLVPTDLIRIEFDVRRCAYHTQLDAVQVEGYAPISDKEAEFRWKKRGRCRIISRKELEWYLSVIEEKNNEKRLALASLPSSNAHTPYADEVDDYPSGLLPLPQFSIETEYIQNSALCPISMGLCKFPSSLTSLALMHQTTLSFSENPCTRPINPLLCFPHEVLLSIFRYLDLPTLCRISCVCRTFHRLADETLSRLESINLQALWPTATDTALSALSSRLHRSRNRTVFACERPRGRGTRSESAPVHYASWSSLTGQGVTHHTTLVCGGGAPPTDRVRASAFQNFDNSSQDVVSSRLKRLDISWCGNYQAISTYGFCQFLSDVGRNLTTLRLSSCQMVNDECLLQLINICGNLEELDLSSCRSVTSGGFIPLGRLIKLRWLSLYRTRVADAALHNLANLCQHLRHLNLGSCVSIVDADTIVEHITANNPVLESLVLWRCRNLTSFGVLRIAEHAPHLLRLDLGWCTGIESEPSNCLRELVTRCRKLRVLSLAAIRSVTPADVDVIANSLYDSLVDLDLIGNALITQPCINRLLLHCRNLAFLDISHCPSISIFEALSLKATYNHCNIVFYHHTSVPSPPRATPMDFHFPQLLPPQHLPPLAFLGPQEDLDG
ncbi:f box:lrr repeat protein 4 [Echinococcus multilocularis]|uniref:F box:lrr repeat protein 4 n=1 Tax=Echinococcus multilocularis TaxID=6211 RepID=A0A068XZ29_ECHMU|nr:f box:lrr repeat protein 4 [Echinococcus multilocularis]